MEVYRGELVGVALYDDGCHAGEIFGDNLSALLHDEDVLRLNLLDELPVNLDIGEKRLELNRYVEW